MFTTERLASTKGLVGATAVLVALLPLGGQYASRLLLPVLAG